MAFIKLTDALGYPVYIPKWKIGALAVNVSANGDPNGTQIFGADLAGYVVVIEPIEVVREMCQSSF